MSGKFIIASDVQRHQNESGSQAWLSRPSTTGAKDLVVTEVTFLPGQGHAFHKHPDQEEVIYILEGVVEQWLDQEKRILSAGDSVFIPADLVHASFTMGDSPAKVLAILGPCVGEDGYVSVEVAEQSPWNTLR